jgi:hypothetical protein
MAKFESTADDAESVRVLESVKRACAEDSFPDGKTSRVSVGPSEISRLFQRSGGKAGGKRKAGVDKAPAEQASFTFRSSATMEVGYFRSNPRLVVFRDGGPGITHRE